eukprot:1117950-Amphidinium_carterae.2
MRGNLNSIKVRPSPVEGSTMLRSELLMEQMDCDSVRLAHWRANVPHKTQAVWHNSHSAKLLMNPSPSFQQLSVMHLGLACESFQGVHLSGLLKQHFGLSPQASLSNNSAKLVRCLTMYSL